MSKTFKNSFSTNSSESLSSNLVKKDHSYLYPSKIDVRYFEILNGFEVHFYYFNLIEIDNYNKIDLFYCPEALLAITPVHSQIKTKNIFSLKNSYFFCEGMRYKPEDINEFYQTIKDKLRELSDFIIIFSCLMGLQFSLKPILILTL